MSRLWALITRIFVTVFGHWDPPHWLRWIGQQGGRGGGWAWAHKVKAGLALVGLLAVSAGGTYGWRWWQSRPKPATVGFDVTEPSVTPIGDKVVPRPLSVVFAESVAPLKAV